MNSRVILLAAVFLVLTVSTAAVIAAPTGETTPTETALIEHPNSSEPTSTFGETSLNMANDAAIGERTIRSDYAYTLFEERLAAAPNQSAREAVLQSYFTAIDDRVRALMEAEQSAVQANDEPGHFLRELSLITAEAEAHQDNLDRLLLEDDTFPGTTLRPQIVDRQHSLDLFSSEARSELLRAIRANEYARVQYYSRTDDSLILTAVTDDQYIRDAVRYDRYRPDTPDQFESLSEVLGTAVAEFPPATENDLNVLRQPLEGLFYVEFGLVRGPITAYLDGGSTSVVRAHQRQHKSEITFTDSTVETANGITVTVNRTYDDGPMKVTVVDADTGEVLPATVTMNEDVTVESGADGTAWLVEPRRLMRLNISTAEGSVDLTLV